MTQSCTNVIQTMVGGTSLSGVCKMICGETRIEPVLVSMHLKVLSKLHLFKHTLNSVNNTLDLPVSHVQYFLYFVFLRNNGK